MPGKPELPDDELYEVATYLMRPEVQTEIHAELHPNAVGQFQQRYLDSTQGVHPPAGADAEPYYVWPVGVNKYGKQLRIYFRNVPPVPPVMRRLYTDQGKWYARRESYRVNHSNLVFQLFECGFLLGNNADNEERIQEFMANRFPPIQP